MIRLLIFTLALYTAYFAYMKYAPDEKTPDETAQQTSAAASPYIIVYGRKTCGNTTRMMRQLDRAGVGYAFRDIDNGEQNATLNKRMREAGHNTRSYMLPVIEIANKFYINPFPEEVLRTYRSAKG